MLAKHTRGQLANSIANVARDNAQIVLVESGRPYQLNNSVFDITTWLSDYCDPLIWGKQLPCFSPNPFSRAIDSVSLIADDNFSASNLNDAVSSNLDTYLHKVEIRADLVMGVFSAAGSLPQCMSNFSPTQKCDEKEIFLDNSMERLARAGNELKAKYKFSFSGKYILSVHYLC